MPAGKLLFAQLMDYVPPMVFERCVARYSGNRKVKSFSCTDHFQCMAFAQLTFRESLRDIEACLRSQAGTLYHMGIRAQVARNTLANANATRNWRIYANFTQRLTGITRKLYADEPFGVDLSDTAYTQRYRVHPGFDDYRLVAVAVSVGTVPNNQGASEAAYAAGPARQYPVAHPHQRRQAA
jgi:hypothetical protein